MRTYNATIRLGGKLENEVFKNNLTTPEILVLRSIHGSDAVVKVSDSGEWAEHFGLQTVRDEDGDLVEEQREYEDAAERDRLTQLYGEALISAGVPATETIGRMFGTYAPLPTELPEFRQARVLAAAEKAKPVAKPATKKAVAKEEPLEDFKDDDLEEIKEEKVAPQGAKDKNNLTKVA